MNFEKVDINDIKLDAPQDAGGFEPVDINSIKLDDTQPDQNATPRTWGGYAADVAENVPRMALQGATLGFGDEVSSALGAGVKSLATGKPFGPEYNRQLAFQQGKINEAQQENPVLSPVAEIGGTIGAALPIAGTKAGAALGGWASRGLAPQATSLAGRAYNLFSKSLVGSATGAAGTAAYGAGTAEQGHRTEGARQGAILGASIGAVAPVAIAGIAGTAGAVKQTYKGLTARDAEALDAAAAKIKERASGAYQKMREIGAVFKPETTNKIVYDLEQSVINDGPLNEGLHGKTMSVIAQIKDAAAKEEFDIEKADQWRQLLGQVAGNRTPDNIQDARKASIAIDALDDAISAMKPDALKSGDISAVNALKYGRAEYARQAKFNTVADIIKKADGDANYMKRELKKLYDNKKKTRGFTKQEIEALKDASRLSGAEAIAKTLGRFGLDVGNSRIGTGVGGMVGSAAGYAIGGPVGAAAVPIAGTAGRVAQKGIARAKAEDLLKIIENGGTVSRDDVLKLSPKEGAKVLDKIKQMQYATMPDGKIVPRITVRPSDKNLNVK